MCLGTCHPQLTDVFLYCAGQPGLPQPKHSGRQAKPYKHASPFRKASEDRPFATGNMPSTNGAHVNEVPAFPAFPQSPGTALNGMHTGVGSSRGDAPSAIGTYMSGGLRTFPRSPGPALNGIHAGIGSSTGAADSAASAAAAAAQLPPKFASAMNISEGNSKLSLASACFAPQNKISDAVQCQ